MDDYKYKLNIRQYEAYNEAYYNRHRSYEWNFNYAGHGPDPRNNQNFNYCRDSHSNGNFDNGPEPRNNSHFDHGASSTSSWYFDYGPFYDNRRHETGASSKRQYEECPETQLALEDHPQKKKKTVNEEWIPRSKAYKEYYEEYKRRRSYQWNFNYAGHGPDPRNNQNFNYCRDSHTNWNFDKGPEPRNNWHFDHGASSTSNWYFDYGPSYDNRKHETGASSKRQYEECPETQLALEDRPQEKKKTVNGEQASRSTSHTKTKQNKQKPNKKQTLEKEQKQELKQQEPIIKGPLLHEDVKQKRIESIVTKHGCMKSLAASQGYIETVTSRSISLAPETIHEFRPSVLTTVTTTVDFTNPVKSLDNSIKTSEYLPNILTEPILSEDEGDYDPEQDPILDTESIHSEDEYSHDPEHKPIVISDDSDLEDTDVGTSTKSEARITLDTENILSDEDSITLAPAAPNISSNTTLQCINETQTYPIVYSQEYPLLYTETPTPAINTEKYPVLYTETISSDDDTVEMTLAEPTTSIETTLYDPYADTFSTVNMVIVLWNYPEEKFTEKQEVSLRRTLLEEVLKCPQGKSPTFDNSYFEKGAMYIICANEESRNWLLENVPRMQPWKGAVLKIGTKEQILKNNKVALWISKNIVEMTDVMQILELLEKQNNKLITKDWIILDSQTNSQGISLTLSIDYKSWSILSDMNFLPYLGLGQIEFKRAK